VEAASVADCAAGVAAPCAAALFSFSGEHAIRVHAETTASAAFKNLDFMIYLLFKIHSSCHVRAGGHLPLHF
jgi:hypothetical protein